jgi:hypothetical protein
MSLQKKIQHCLNEFKTEIRATAVRLELYQEEEEAEKDEKEEKKEKEDETETKKKIRALMAFIETYEAVPKPKPKPKAKVEVEVEATSSSLEKTTTKRKRVVTEIAPEFRCLAKLEDGERCNRKKSGKKDFCSIHKNEIPFGIIEKENGQQHVIIFLEDIEGIHYYMDENHNIYCMESIKKGIKNPPIIGKKVFHEEKKHFVCELLATPIPGPGLEPGPEPEPIQEKENSL